MITQLPGESSLIDVLVSFANESFNARFFIGLNASGLFCLYRTSRLVRQQLILCLSACIAHIIPDDDDMAADESERASLRVCMMNCVGDLRSLSGTNLLDPCHFVPRLLGCIHWIHYSDEHQKGAAPRSYTQRSITNYLNYIAASMVEKKSLMQRFTWGNPDRTREVNRFRTRPTCGVPLRVTVPPIDSVCNRDFYVCCDDDV